MIRRISQKLSKKEDLTNDELVRLIRGASEKKVDELTQGLNYKVQPIGSEQGGFSIRTYFMLKYEDNDIDVYAVDMDAMQVMQFNFVGRTPINEAKKAFLIDYIYHNSSETEEGEAMRNIQLKKNFWRFKNSPLLEDKELELTSNSEDNE